MASIHMLENSPIEEGRARRRGRMGQQGCLLAFKAVRLMMCAISSNASRIIKCLQQSPKPKYKGTWGQQQPNHRGGDGVWLKAEGHRQIKYTR